MFPFAFSTALQLKKEKKQIKLLERIRKCIRYIIKYFIIQILEDNLVHLIICIKLWKSFKSRYSLTVCLFFWKWEKYFICSNLRICIFYCERGERERVRERGKEETMQTRVDPKERKTKTFSWLGDMMLSWRPFCVLPPSSEDACERT